MFADIRWQESDRGFTTMHLWGLKDNALKYIEIFRLVRSKIYGMFGRMIYIGI